MNITALTPIPLTTRRLLAALVAGMIAALLSWGASAAPPRSSGSEARSARVTEAQQMLTSANAQYQEIRAKANAEYKAKQAECDKLQGNAKKACAKDAKAARKQALTEAKAAWNKTTNEAYAKAPELNPSLQGSVTP
jgi:hypothetical protein